MTEAPVPLAAQIEKVQREVEKWNAFGCAHPKMTPGERDLAARELEMWRAVLATLQQHERLTAAIAAANERIARLEGALRKIATLITPTPAGKPLGEGK